MRRLCCDVGRTFGCTIIGGRWTIKAGIPRIRIVTKVSVLGQGDDGAKSAGASNMFGQISPVLSSLSPSQVVALAIVAMGVGFVTLVSLTGIIVPAWAGLKKLRLETALKQQMLERGMSAEEIVAVLNGPTRNKTAVDYPCASEVVVESDGEWTPGLILQRQGDRLYVHYVGCEMSDNEWVGSERVRFPASSQAQGGWTWDGAVPAGFFDKSQWCPQSKKTPVDAEV
jgi:hypothetical protein